MQKMTYKGQEGYFIPTDQKKILDRVVLPLLRANNCGEDYDDKKL